MPYAHLSNAAVPYTTGWVKARKSDDIFLLLTYFKKEGTYAFVLMSK